MAVTAERTDLLRGYLEGLAAFGRANDRLEGWTHQSIEALVLAHGRAWTPQRRPAAYRKRAFRQCFRNAFELAQDHPELTYVEGYADAGIIPVEHAWCVDRVGRVVDPTWRAAKTAESAYFGVALATRWVTARIVRTGVYGAFCWRNIRDLLEHGLPPEALAILDRQE